MSLRAVTPLTRWAAPIAALLAVAVWSAPGCDRGTDPPTSGGGGTGDAGGGPDDDGGMAGRTIDRAALVADLAEHVILPLYAQALDAGRQLDSQVAALVAAEGTDADARSAARDAYREAMRAWQRAEVFIVGPAGSSLLMLGGQDLRDDIYSWPTVNACRVDQEIVANRFEEPAFFDGALVNVYGLDVLEHLLFVDGAANACPPQVPINQQGTWAALSADERARRRARYAGAVSRRLVQDLERLHTAWSPEGGNFVRAFGRPNGTPYSNAREVIDQLYAALLYVDRQVKDSKVAVPAGIMPGCGRDVCPERLELSTSKLSRDALVANLEGFLYVLRGELPGAPDRVGFVELLTALNSAELGERMAANTEAAIAVLQGLPDDDLGVVLETDLDAVLAAHAAIKKVTDDLKSQFVAVLNITLPQEGAADND